MLFNSYLFILVFLPITLGIYLLLIRQGWRKQSFDWLVLASIFFYGWWKWTNVPLLLGSLLFNYTVGTWLGRIPPGRRAKALLIAGLTGNLVFLGYFKYANFFIDNANSLFGLGWTFTHLVLPLGISFITFQKIAYLVDSSQGLTRGYGFRDFCLFVSFFPQLIAGPIVHHSELMPQFRRKDSAPTWEDFGVGVTHFVLGLAKKVLIADPFATFANPVFNAARNGTDPGFAVARIGTLAYTMQIYCDFSGYTDVARGSAMLMGFTLPENFDRPYLSTSPAAFWRRWHMTLSSWLRDYVYFPLGGSKGSTFRTYFNLWLTLFLIGIWHGASWTCVIYGALHGGAMVVHRFFYKRSGRTADTRDATWLIVLKIAATFHFVVLSRILFRSPSLGAAEVVTAQLFKGTSSLAQVSWTVWAVLIVSFAIHWTPKRFVGLARNFYVGLPAPAQGLVLAMAGAVMMRMASSQVVPYIYFQF